MRDANIRQQDLTQSEVLQELTNEEAKRVAGGGAVYHTTSSVMFLSLGIELEDSQ